MKDDAVPDPCAGVQRQVIRKERYKPLREVFAGRDLVLLEVEVYWKTVK